MDPLPKLGTGWVGVTQIPTIHPDAGIARLNGIGCARCASTCSGGPDQRRRHRALATRVHSIAGWHSEIYADAAAPRPYVELAKLPQLCIDHLGMTEDGIPTLLELVAAGLQGEGHRLRPREDGRAEGALRPWRRKPERAGVRHRHLPRRARAASSRPISIWSRKSSAQSCQSVLGQSAGALSCENNGCRLK